MVYPYGPSYGMHICICIYIYITCVYTCMHHVAPLKRGLDL